MFLMTMIGIARSNVINDDGTEQIQLTHNAVDDYDPTWSPDGQKIAFCSDRDGLIQVYVRTYADEVF